MGRQIRRASEKILRKDPNKYSRYKKNSKVLYMCEDYVVGTIKAIRYADGVLYYKLEISAADGTLNIVEVTHAEICPIIPYWRWWLRQKFWFLVF